MTPETRCTDNECPYNGMCMRWSTSSNVEWRFTETPRKGDRCDMFWGLGAQGIMDYLESVVNGEAIKKVKKEEKDILDYMEEIAKEVDIYEKRKRPCESP